ncbi:transporter substrate-binding domain-containing protein [Actinokineospora sp. HUAS TT18]|uniref:transporter substrate-binding domain-containing protein n=1 Tax=Actinokineospora sp. HUAS TT18 TaxID=3447451 RepID=UPI003F52534D
MKAALVLAVIAALAACSAPAPQPRSDRAAPPVLPDGYTESPQRSQPETCDLTTRDPREGPRGDDGRPTGDKVRRIREKNELVVGVSQTAPFFSKRDLVTGELVGFEIDIAQRIAAALLTGYTPGDPRLRLITLPTGSRLTALDTDANDAARRADPAGKEIPHVDLVIADVSITCERQRTYGLTYSMPYLSTNSGLLVRTGLKDVTGPADLRGRKVCSGRRTTNSDEMIELRDQQATGPGEPIIPVAVADTSECLMLLQRGLVDAIYTDVLILKGYQQQDPGTVLLDYHDSDDGKGLGKAGIAVSGKDDQIDLVRFVNRVLGEMMDDGSLQRAYDARFAEVPARHRLPLPPNIYRP